MNVFIVTESLFSGSLHNPNHTDSEKVEEKVMCFSHNWQAFKYLDDNGYKQNESIASKNPDSVSVWAKEKSEKKYYIADVAETKLK